MSASDRYDIAEESLKSFTRSKVRTKILLCLKEGAKGTGDLEKEMGIRNTTILHAIKEMIDSDLVTRADKGYRLTNLGKIQACMLDEMIDFVLALEGHRDFWQTHDISGIPIDLLKRIGMLAHSDIIASDHFDPLKTQNYFLKEIINSKQIYGVSPIMMPDFPLLIATLVKKGSGVNLILTTDILKIIYKDHRDLVRELLSHENFVLYHIDESVTTAFTVTDSLLNLGLFRIDGGYDLASDLICMGEDAIKWGMELFDFYREKSVLIEGDLRI
jgi:predicted transcriptional regulator